MGLKVIWSQVKFMAQELSQWLAAKCGHLSDQQLNGPSGGLGGL